MAVIEIVGGVILLVVSVVIFALTLMQHTHGQGLAGVINGSAYGANNARLTPADQMLAKVTRIAGIIFFVVAILACVFASRLAWVCARSPVMKAGLFLCLSVVIKEIRGKKPRPGGGRAMVVKEKENLCQCAIKSNMPSRTSPAPSKS